MLMFTTNMPFKTRRAMSTTRQQSMKYDKKLGLFYFVMLRSSTVNRKKVVLSDGLCITLVLNAEG